MLFIVSTPIGNLEDITLRALRILQEVDYILCEDTRKTKILIDTYHIHTPLKSFHSYTSQEKIDSFIQDLLSWKKLALVSDSGTPGICDPWYALITKAIQKNIPISPIPWPCAAIAALTVSGLHMHQFLFLWFLPKKKWRKQILTALKELPYTLIIYESIHRIETTLQEFALYFWEKRPIVIARELTKIFETIHRDTIQGMIEYFRTHPQEKRWECIILL